MEDDFAQSRGADDLFMDEFETPDEATPTYVPEPAAQAAPSPKPAQLSGENLERHTQAHYDQLAYQNDNQGQNEGQGGQGGRGGRRGRGRGRGGNVEGQGQQHGGGGLASSKYNTNNNQNRAQQPQATPAPAPAAQPTTTSPPPTNTDDKPQPLERVDDTIASIAAPTGPTVQHRVQAVRGDRSATGPAKPKKRTEAEITELMAKMKLKSSKATELHERTKKDQAEFEQREREARKEREEKVIRERQNVRAMDSERAKNAMRKEKAMQGREWDSEKRDRDIVDKMRGGSSRYMKGANGGVARDVVPRREVGERMEEAARAVRSVEDEFPVLGAGMSGARGAAGRGGGIAAKQGGRGDLFPNGPGAGAGRGGRGGSNNSSNRGAPAQGGRGGGLATSRYADVVDDKKAETRKGANTDIRLEEPKVEVVEKKIDLEAGKKELEELKKEGGVKSWAEEANDAA